MELGCAILEAEWWQILPKDFSWILSPQLFRSLEDSKAIKVVLNLCRERELQGKDCKSKNPEAPKRFYLVLLAEDGGEI